MGPCSFSILLQIGVTSPKRGFNSHITSARSSLTAFLESFWEVEKTLDVVFSKEHLRQSDVIL